MNYRDFAGAFAALAGSDGSLEGVEAALGLAADDASVHELIDAVLSTGPVAALAAASYQHAFGFSKLVLVDGAGAFKLRLHLWPPGSRESDLHDHRWSFCSRVLAGGYRFEEYAVTPGEGWHAFRYRPVGRAADFPLEPLGPRAARCVRTGWAVPGTVYALEADRPHRVITQDGPGTVSLVLQGADVREATTVLTQEPRPPAAGNRVPVTRLDSWGYVQRLLRIRRLLRPGPDALGEALSR